MTAFAIILCKFDYHKLTSIEQANYTELPETLAKQGAAPPSLGFGGRPTEKAHCCPLVRLSEGEGL